MKCSILSFLNFFTPTESILLTVFRKNDSIYRVLAIFLRDVAIVPLIMKLPPLTICSSFTLYLILPGCNLKGFPLLHFIKRENPFILYNPLFYVKG
jgi:hypothetical protein